jgi:4-diphosphocytidyl-2-C-methyl-D-erythritol kinase
MSEPRRARVPALAKINLDLRVLARRPDQFHELRTVFQTVSLADTLDLAFTPGRRTSIELEDSAQIPDNLVVRAATAALDAMRVRGRLEMRLVKRIPMGAGLGGGSSDAAAVLLALPVLAGRAIPFDRLSEIAATLGSDLNFFFHGGTAAGIGRGTELFPLPDGPARHGLLIAPGVHVSTADAYRDLSPRLTPELQRNKMNSFQSLVWGAGEGSAVNDFEPVVFAQHPRLAALKRRLIRAGAAPALMSGSGSSLFGLFTSREAAARARDSFAAEAVFAISLVSRVRYRRLWWRALRPHLDGELWPPRSRYRNTTTAA